MVFREVKGLNDHFGTVQSILLLADKLEQIFR